MFRRRSQVGLGLVSLIPLVVLLAAGCGKSRQPATPASTQTLSNQVVLATHWIGKARMAQDTNAAYQMELWKLPESERLEQQTLDKLAHALPALLGIPSGADTNLLPGLIRPLLDDLVQAESFTELRSPTNRPAEFALAIRLSPERAALWQTNLAVLKEALTVPTTNSGSLPKSLQFLQAGEWAVLGLGSGDSPLFNDFGRRFSVVNLPSSINAASNHWLELDADLSHLLRSNPVFPAESLPVVHLTLAGEGQAVRTRGEMTFAKPPAIKLDPWSIPTNLIYDPLVSFTAVRGIKSWIESSSVLGDSLGGKAPNQLYSWSLGQIPSQSYFAAIWADSSKRFVALSDRIVQYLDSQDIPNGLGKSSRMTNANVVYWTENPFSQPFLKHEIGSAGEIVFGGFAPLTPTGQPIPPELLPQFTSQPNVLYYDWEITAGRTTGWLYLGQFMRFVSGKAQLKTGCAGLSWLQGVGPKLGNAATVVHLVAPHRLTVSRTSSAGFTGIELQILMDWLESPSFPQGIHTFLAPAPVTTPPSRRPASPPENGGHK